MTAERDLIKSLLHLIKAEPSLLPAAPANRDTWGREITWRSEHEVHSCLRCGQRAHRAYIVETDAGPRWLDVCHECGHHAVMANAEEWPEEVRDDTR